MLRNDLITRLSDYDNDAVVVSICGALIDVDSVGYDKGSIVVILDPEDMQATLPHTGSTNTVYPLAGEASPEPTGGSGNQ